MLMAVAGAWLAGRRRRAVRQRRGEELALVGAVPVPVGVVAVRDHGLSVHGRRTGGVGEVEKGQTLCSRATPALAQPTRRRGGAEEEDGTGRGETRRPRGCAMG